VWGDLKMLVEKIKVLIGEAINDIYNLEEKMKEKDVEGSLELFMIVAQDVGKLFAYREIFEKITGECLDVDFDDDIFKIENKLLKLEKDIKVFLRGGHK